MNRTLLALLAGFFLLQMPFCFVLDAYNGSEGVYWQTMRQLSSGRSLYSEVFYSQWPLFIETARLSRFLPGTDLFMARFVLLLFAPAALLGMYLIGCRLRSAETGLFAAGLLAVEPLFFNLSHQLTGEIPALALVLFAVWILLRFPQSHRALAGAAVLLGLSVQLKPLMGVALGVVLALYAVYAPFRAGRRWVLAGALGAGALLINLICLWWSGWFAGGGFDQLQGGLIRSLLSGGSRAGVGAFSFFANGDYSRGFAVVTLPCLVISVILLWRQSRDLARALAIASGAMLVVLAAHVKLNTDHLILFSPLAVLAISACQSPRRPGHSWLAGAFIAGSLLITGAEWDWSFPKPRGTIRRAQAIIQKHTSADELVMGNALFVITAAGRMTPPEYADFSAARAESGSLNCASLEERFQKGDVKAFVLGRKGLEHLDCGGMDFRTVVTTYFPNALYEDSRLQIFTSRKAEP